MEVTGLKPYNDCLPSIRNASNQTNRIKQSNLGVDTLKRTLEGKKWAAKQLKMIWNDNPNGLAHIKKYYQSVGYILQEQILEDEPFHKPIVPSVNKEHTGEAVQYESDSSHQEQALQVIWIEPAEAEDTKSVVNYIKPLQLIRIDYLYDEIIVQSFCCQEVLRIINKEPEFGDSYVEIGFLEQSNIQQANCNLFGLQPHILTQNEAAKRIQSTWRMFIFRRILRKVIEMNKMNEELNKIVAMNQKRRRTIMLESGVNTLSKSSLI